MARPYNFIVLLALLLFPLATNAYDSTTKILSQVYGSFSTACTQDTDADTGEHNRLAMAEKRRWVVYCHDGAGAGVACECLQGTSTVDASSSVGFILFAGEKMIVLQKEDNTHISCVPYVNDQQYDICPLD
jgi:hypothetical protein